MFLIVIGKCIPVFSSNINQFCFS